MVGGLKCSNLLKVYAEAIAGVSSLHRAGFLEAFGATLQTRPMCYTPNIRQADTCAMAEGRTSESESRRRYGHRSHKLLHLCESAGYS